MIIDLVWVFNYEEDKWMMQELVRANSQAALAAAGQVQRTVAALKNVLQGAMRIFTCGNAAHHVCGNLAGLVKFVRG